MAQVATILGAELPLRLSHSFLRRAACPLCLKWTYVERIEQRYARQNALRGQAAHLAIAALTDLCTTEHFLPAQLSDEQVRCAVAETTPHEVFADLGVILLWLALWRDRFDLKPRHLVGFEERMAIDERYAETTWDDASYRGIVDTIHIFGRTAIVQDYKSQPNILSQSALDQHEQGSFYCWLVSKFYPQLEEFVFRIWYLRYGFFAETRRSRHELALFEQKLLLQQQKLREITSWDPIPGEHCGVCDFIHLCPVANDASTLPTEIISRAQAERVAGELRVKEQWVKNAKAKLKVYVEHNDSVRLADYEYGFRARESVQWSAEQALDIVRDRGLPAGELIRANTKELDGLFKQAERQGSPLADELAPARQTRTATAFRGYRLPADDSEHENERGDHGP